MAFVYAWIVPLWAYQLLLQLLMEQFDTLRIQCRHIEHMHEGVYNFLCNVSPQRNNLIKLHTMMNQREGLIMTHEVVRAKENLMMGRAKDKH